MSHIHTSNKQSHIVSWLVWIVIGIGIFGLYDSWQAQSRPTITPDVQQEEYLATKADMLYDILSQHYYLSGDVERDVMDERALQSFVNAIEDPYTVYLDNQQNERLMETLEWSNNFEWIGAYISKKDQWILVEQVIKGWPAFKAWVLPLDIIVDVNGSWLQHVTIDEAVGMLRGPAESTATLTIFRSSGETDEILTIDVIREKINIPSVESEIIQDGDLVIGHLIISTFGDDTERLLRKEILALKEQNIDWLIFDVRWNGWGLLDIAVQVASHFIPKGETVVEARYSDGNTITLESFGYGDFEDIPLVVMIDFFSASASEILALALAEQRDAPLVGTQTIGKWSIQTIQPLGDGSSLKYTIGRRYSPSWLTIDREWIQPDVLIEYQLDEQNEEADNQRDRALEVLRELIE